MRNLTFDASRLQKINQHTLGSNQVSLGSNLTLYLSAKFNLGYEFKLWDHIHTFRQISLLA
jgi:hypothetical protein